MSIQKFIVSKDDSIYEAWPDVVQTNSGKLICVFSECEHHVDRENARIVICESKDRGRTWSEKKPLTEKGKKNDFFNCPRISKLNNGSLAIICDKVKGTLGNQREQTAEQYIWYGDSEGGSWSEAQILPFCGIVPNKLMQLKCGRFLVCAHFLNFETDKLEQYLWYSDDNGKTWGEVVNTPIDCGHRPVSGFLNDGSVMVTYRYIPLWMQNVFAAFLRKEDLLETEREKQNVRIMPLDYDRNAFPDSGYTGWTQFDDGEIYVVNYIKDDADKAYIRGYSFYPEDIVLPETKNTF